MTASARYFLAASAKAPAHAACLARELIFDAELPSVLRNHFFSSASKKSSEMLQYSGSAFISDRRFCTAKSTCSPLRTFAAVACALDE